MSSATRCVVNRVTANSMEPRGCLAQYDRDEDRYTIRCTMQSVHATRAALADQIFRVPQHQFRVVCDNMGGGFGMKGGCYPGIRAVAVGVGGHRPSGALDRRAQRRAAERRAGPRQRRRDRAGARHGRQVSRAARAAGQAAIGAYYSTDRPTIPLTIGLGCLVNTYGIPAVHAEVMAVLTNTMTIAPYRGGSRPEPIYVTETIIDKAARELGIDAGRIAPPQHDPGERDAVHDGDAADL